jgi:replication-associated recombination protein RarA
MKSNERFEMRTSKGYCFFEASSTLQKAIRRGEEDVAMYFAVELFNSNYGEYVWKRLKIMSSEDIGLAEPLMPAVIQSLYQMFVDQAKKKDEKHQPERLFLTQAVLTLCRARKSRLIDWTLLAYWNEHPNRSMAIPDYAFDKHNQKGRAMGRGLDHFYKEGSHLNNHFEQPGESEAKQRAYNSQSASRTLFD